MIMIEEFLDKERQKVKGLDRLFGNYPTIRRTSQIIGTLPRKVGEVTAIYTSVASKLIAIVLGLFAGFMWLTMLSLVISGKAPVPGVLGFLFVSFILFLLMERTFFNRKYVFTIILDKGGITVHDQKTRWTDVAETCIMVQRLGRGNNSTLLLFLKNGEVARYDLYNFTIPDRRLAGLIEYYKK